MVINEHFEVVRSTGARSVSGIRGRMESRVRAVNRAGRSDAARKICLATGVRPTSEVYTNIVRANFLMLNESGPRCPPTRRTEWERL